MGKTAAIVAIAGLTMIGCAGIFALLPTIALATHRVVSAALTNATEGLARSAAERPLAAQTVAARGFGFFANTSAAVGGAMISTTGAVVPTGTGIADAFALVPNASEEARTRPPAGRHARDRRDTEPRRRGAEALLPGKLGRGGLLLHQRRAPAHRARGLRL
jgi:hypothetical protein